MMEWKVLSKVDAGEGSATGDDDADRGVLNHATGYDVDHNDDVEHQHRIEGRQFVTKLINYSPIPPIFFSSIPPILFSLIHNPYSTIFKVYVDQSMLGAAQTFLMLPMPAEQIALFPSMYVSSTCTTDLSCLPSMWWSSHCKRTLAEVSGEMESIYK
jgi:hypothetical protein